MTKWNNNTKLAIHTDIVKVVLGGKEQPAIFTRGYGRFRMRTFVKGPSSASIARSSATRPEPAGIVQDDTHPTNTKTTNK